MKDISEKLSADYKHWPFWVVPVCLSLILVLGFLIRIEDMRAWQEAPERAFVEGEPLLTNIDGYFYLRIARDLVEGTYRNVDPLRITPDHPERPSIPPLLPVIAAAVHKLTNFSFNWIGVFLPVVLGMSLVFPLYGVGKMYGGPLVGITTALTGIISNTYFVRTSVGWFDTDCLNVTLTFAAVYFFLRFGIEKQSKRYWFFLAGIINWFIFLWWWDQGPVPATVISLAPLVIAVVFYFRPSRKLRNRLVVLFFLMLGSLLAWKGGDAFINFYKNIAGYAIYLTGAEVGDFPNISQLVGEQRDLKFVEVVAGVTDSAPVLILGLIGLGWLICSYPKKALFLSVPLMLGAFGMFWAQRFLIFLGPVVALGMGFLVSSLWRLRYRFRVLRAAVPTLLILVVGITLQTDLATTQWSKFDSRLVEGFKYLEKNVPEDAVVWAWWDWGHPLIYWSGKAAISDGAAHGGELSVYNAIPLASSSPREAANLVTFYVTHGHRGMRNFYEAVGDDPGVGLKLIKEIFSVGPVQARHLIDSAGLLPVNSLITVDDWLSYLFPPAGRPIYLFIDYRLGRLAYWWYWMGTWDITSRSGVHTRYMAFDGMYLDKNGATNKRDIYADFRTGEVTLLSFAKSLKSVSIFDNTGEISEESYSHDAMAYLEIYKPAGYGALQRADIKESLFNRLFLRHEKNDFFRQVMIQDPVYQIYRVIGESAGGL